MDAQVCPNKSRLSRLLALLGFGKDVQSGRIYEKMHREAYEEPRMDFIIAGEIVMPTVVNDYFPAKYILRIEDTSGEKRVTQDIFVHRGLYESKKVGDTYP